MTFAELRALTLVFLDDLNAGYFKTDQVNTWLNNALREVQKKLIQAGDNYYLKCVQTTLVANQSDYVIPQDFKKLNRLEVMVDYSLPPNENVQPILPMTLMQRDQIGTGTGQPAFYILKKNRLTLYPCPDQGLTMRLYYTYQVTEMEDDSDTPDCPEAYHELIALYATRDGFVKDGRVQELLAYKISQYEEHMKQDAVERNQDVPREIVTTGDPMPAMWGW